MRISIQQLWNKKYTYMRTHTHTSVHLHVVQPLKATHTRMTHL